MPLEAVIVGRPALTREAIYQAIGKSQNVFDDVGSDSFRKIERSGNVPDTSRVREPEFSKRSSKGKLACSPFRLQTTRKGGKNEQSRISAD